MLAAPGALGPAKAAPPALEQEDDQDGEHFLELPGVGRIPLPPGARAFGPGLRAPAPRGLAPDIPAPGGEAPYGGARRPEPKSPESRRAETLERLFGKLAAAEDEREAQAVAAAIAYDWAQSGSDTVDLLAARAEAAELAGAPPLAKSLLDYVVRLAPEWAEGFVRRGRVNAAGGDPEAALRDFETAVKIDGRRYDALAAIGALAESQGDKKRALDAYRRSLAISPRQDALRKTEERLRLDAEGRDI